MKIEKIAELTKLAKQIEEMKNNAIKSITDMKELRIIALKKIQKYLADVSKATNANAWLAKTNVSIYWLMKKPQDIEKCGGVKFNFHKNGTVDIYQHSFASNLEINNFTNLTEEDFFCSHNQNQWEDGFVELIEKWHEIKPQIESEAEKMILKRMDETQTELANFKASYELVANFEI